MRKVMLSLVFVLGAMTMINAENEVEKVDISISTEIKTIEEDGCARDCINSSLEIIEPMDGQPYHRRMYMYKYLYKRCYESECE